MSSLNAIELKNRPILLDKVVVLSSWNIESICRIGLPNPKRNRFSFFFRGGGGGFWILTFHGRIPKKHPKNVSLENSICKPSLISWVISVQCQCPMNLLPSRILMALNLCQGTESR